MIGKSLKAKMIKLFIMVLFYLLSFLKKIIFVCILDKTGFGFLKVHCLEQACLDSKSSA